MTRAPPDPAVLRAPRRRPRLPRRLARRRRAGRRHPHPARQWHDHPGAREPGGARRRDVPHGEDGHALGDAPDGGHLELPPDHGGAGHGEARRHAGRRGGRPHGGQHRGVRRRGLLRDRRHRAGPLLGGDARPRRRGRAHAVLARRHPAGRARLPGAADQESRREALRRRPRHPARAHLRRQSLCLGAERAQGEPRAGGPRGAHRPLPAPLRAGRDGARGERQRQGGGRPRPGRAPLRRPALGAGAGPQYRGARRRPRPLATP